MRSSVEALAAHPEVPTAVAQQAMAVVALSDAIKQLKQEQDTRYHALEDRLNGIIQEADALITGLHQDMANLILRQQAVMRWLVKQFPAFEADVQTEWEHLMQEAAAQVAQEQEKEASHEKSATDHV